jgi:hypothetical protein
MKVTQILSTAALAGPALGSAPCCEGGDYDVIVVGKSFWNQSLFYR